MTALDAFFVNTTEKDTYVITSATFIEELTEHFDTGNNSCYGVLKTNDFYGFVNFNDTTVDTTSCYCTTTCDREYVFN